MVVTASDVVSDDDVRAIVDKIRNQYLQARRAFRDHDATNINSNSYEFPVADDSLDGEAVEVPEGSDFPRSGLNRSTVAAAYTKYGVEIPITDEAVSDSAIDIEMDANEELIRAEERRMDSIAFNVLSSNTNASGPIDANSNNNDEIEYADIVAAKQLAFTSELSNDNLVLLAAGSDMEDFLNMTEFTQASELGDSVIVQGRLPDGDITAEAFLGMVSGVPVYLSNTGAFTAGQAFLVDVSNFGWESTRWETEVVSYPEDSRQQTVWQISGRWDWVATNPEANVEINT